MMAANGGTRQRGAGQVDSVTKSKANRTVPAYDIYSPFSEVAAAGWKISAISQPPCRRTSASCSRVTAQVKTRPVPQKRTPSSLKRLEFLSCCLYLGSCLAGQRGVGGWGTARSAYISYGAPVPLVGQPSVLPPCLLRRPMPALRTIRGRFGKTDSRCARKTLACG